MNTKLLAIILLILGLIGLFFILFYPFSEEQIIENESLEQPLENISNEAIVRLNDFFIYGVVSDPGEYNFWFDFDRNIEGTLDIKLWSACRVIEAEPRENPVERVVQKQVRNSWNRKLELLDEWNNIEILKLDYFEGIGGVRLIGKEKNPQAILLWEATFIDTKGKVYHSATDLWHPYWYPGYAGYSTGCCLLENKTCD